MMSKINQVLLDWKTGDVHGIKWLKEKGLSRRHSYYYLQEGVFHKLGPAVFSKSGDEVDWRGYARTAGRNELRPYGMSQRDCVIGRGWRGGWWGPSCRRHRRRGCGTS
jgi:hypothetical protein